MLGVIGTKLGMTRVFKENGTSVPVTIIEVANSKIVQRKTPEKDGYYAVQVNFGSKKNVSKSLEKKFKDNDAKEGYLTEFNLSEEEFNFLQDSKEITLHPFSDTKKVDVSGVSKGKGFAGVVKRHNFKTQDATHGNSLSHRAPGSIGQCQFPGRVFKGKKMSGQMGNKLSTVQNLVIQKSLDDENVLLIRGAVPGAIGTVLKILPSIKSNSEDNIFKLRNIANEETPAPTETQAAPTESQAAPTETQAAPTETQAAPTETQAPADDASKGDK